jgi:hypothetical protein
MEVLENRTQVQHGYNIFMYELVKWSSTYLKNASDFNNTNI